MTYESLIHITKLFAIVINKSNDITKDIAIKEFSKFLQLHIETKYIKEFEDLFSLYLDSFSSFASNKKTALNSVKLITICEEIKENLYPQYRVSIVFYLINLIFQIKNNNNSLEFLTLVSELLALSNENYKKLYDFINSEKEKFSSTLKNNETKLLKYFYFEKYQAVIVKILNKNIKINNEKAIKDNFYIIFSNDFFSYKTQQKFYFADFVKNDIQKTEPIAVSVQNLEIKIKEQTIFHKFSCDFFSGELVGIIGKSGSGKTSFLKALSGLNKKFEGKILCDNNINKAFVNQFNSFIPFFTVKEHLLQRLNFLNIPKNKHNEILASVLENVALSEEKNKVAINSDNTAKELSGGQLKRLAIAMELLGNPNLLLLDEATSGLASNDALSLLSILKTITKENKIVITSIHQPDYECFMSFDKILIIDEGGYPIYFDSPLKSIDYFRNIFKRIDKNSLLENYFNPSVLLQLINEKKLNENGRKTNKREKTAEELYSIFDENIQKKQISTKIKKETQKPKTKNYIFKSLFSQLKFSFLVDIKNKWRIFLLKFVPLIAGILLSSLCKYSSSDIYTLSFNTNIPVWILIILLTAFFIGLISSAHEFIFLRQFHKIENLIQNKNIYLNLAKILKYLFYSAIQAFLLIFIAIFLLKIQFHFIYLFLILWTIVFCGNLISLLLSKFFNNISTIYLLIPLIIIPQMIFSGAMINYKFFNKNFPKYNEIPIFADIMPIRWATEACIVNFFINNDYQKIFFKDKQQFIEAEFMLNNLRKNSVKQNKNKEQIKFYLKQYKEAKNNIDKNINAIKNKETLISKQTNFEINKICYNNFDNTIYKVSNNYYSNSTFLIGTKNFFGQKITTNYYNFLILLFFNVFFSVLIIFIKRH